MSRFPGATEGEVVECVREMVSEAVNWMVGPVVGREM